MKKINSLSFKSLIQKKKQILYQILLEDSLGYQSIEEALNISLDIFGDVDLTIVNQSQASVKIVSTTLTNEDNINALVSMVKYYLLSDEGRLAETVRIKSRPDVLQTKTVKLHTGTSITAFLLIDIYNEDYAVDEELLDEIYESLSLVTRLCILEEERQHAYKVDNLTRLYTRDSLIKDIKQLLDADILNKPDYEIHLAVLYISNAHELNMTKGNEYVDECLLKIARAISQQTTGAGAYRIGGMKFAVLFRKNIQDSTFIMQKLIDKIQGIDNDIITSVIVVPLTDNAYKTVYHAEKYLKEVERNVVTVFRGGTDVFEDEELLEFSEILQPKEGDLHYVEGDKPREESNTKFFASTEIISSEDTIVEDTDLLEEEESLTAGDDENDGTGLSLDFGDEDEPGKEKPHKKPKQSKQMNLFDMFS